MESLPGQSRSFTAGQGNKLLSVVTLNAAQFRTPSVPRGIAQRGSNPNLMAEASGLFHYS
jgi:hypothetical protein